MKILMTGSHGFVGKNLIEALSGEHEIIRWDVRSDEELPDCDAVIHLAGKAHDVRCKKEDGREYFVVNTELTKKMFDAFLQSKAKQFIFFSSIKAKDNDTVYARSKKAAEDYILNTNCTNDTNKKVYRWPWPLAAFENQRSYASMGNVSFVVKELLERDVESGVYNICDDEPVSTNDLIRLMCELLGHNAKMLRVPKGIVRFGAKIGDILHLPLNTERLGKLTGDYIVDNSEIKRALGINEMPIQAMEGLEATIRGMITT